MNILDFLEASFSFCEDSYTAKYTKLNPMTTKTYTKYITHLTKELPARFRIMIDGWSGMETSSHYIGVFALYGDNDGTLQAPHFATSKKLGLPLIGFASHRLNLALKQIFAGFETETDLINKSLVELQSLKQSGKLRSKTSLRAQTRNVTR